MRNIHVGEVRLMDRPKADADTVWNSLPKVTLDLDDIFLLYEEKKVRASKKYESHSADKTDF